MPAKREPAKRKPKTKKVSLLLGVGLDGDGERRITKGRDFLLVGGSPDTHELMTEHGVLRARVELHAGCGVRRCAHRQRIRAA